VIVELPSAYINGWYLYWPSLSSLLTLGAAAVIGAFVGMSCKFTVKEKVCCRVGCKATGSGIFWHVVRIILVEGLVLFTGLLSKVTINMMTLSAFLHRRAHSLSTRKSFLVLGC